MPFLKGIFKNSNLILLLLLIFLGFFLRVWRIDQLPRGVHDDEAEFTLVGTKLWESHQLNLYTREATGHPTPLFYLMAASVKFLGPSNLSIRLPSILFGVLNIPATYLLGASLFGPPVGLIAATLATFNRWHLTFSRIGFEVTAAYLFLCLTLTFLVRAAKNLKWRDFLFAGLFLGLGFYTYLAYRAILLLLLLLIPFWFFKVSPKKIFLQKAGVSLFLAFLITLPLIFTAIKNPHEFFGHTNTLFVLSYQPSPTSFLYRGLNDNLIKTLFIFFVQGDPNPMHNVYPYPMLDEVVAGLFLFGLLVVFLPNFFKAPFFLTLVGLPVFLLPTFLSLNPPNSLRAFLTLPFVLLIVAKALASLFGDETKLDKPIWQAGKTVLLFLVILPIAFLNLHFYFFTYANNLQTWKAFSTSQTLAAPKIKEYLVARPTPDLYAATELKGATSKLLLDKTFDQIKPFDQTTIFTFNEKTGNVFVLDEKYESYLDLIKKFYPQVKIETVNDLKGEPFLFFLSLPPLATSVKNQVDNHGLLVSYYGPAKPTGRPILTRMEPLIDFAYYIAPVGVYTPFSIKWQGSLKTPQAGDYTVIFQSDRFPNLTMANSLLKIDGQEAFGPEKVLQVKIKSPGNVLHHLEIETEKIIYPYSFVLSWIKPDGTREVVSFFDLSH